MWNSRAELAQLRYRGGHGDPTYDRYHDPDYGDESEMVTRIAGGLDLAPFSAVAIDG